MANGNYKVKAIFVRGMHSAGNSISFYQRIITMIHGGTFNWDLLPIAFVQIYTFDNQSIESKVRKSILNIIWFSVLIFISLFTGLARPLKSFLC